MTLERMIRLVIYFLFSAVLPVVGIAVIDGVALAEHRPPLFEYAINFMEMFDDYWGVSLVNTGLCFWADIELQNRLLYQTATGVLVLVASVLSIFLVYGNHL